MVLVALALFCMSVVLSIGEAYFERDWPRDTFRYVLIFGVILLVSVSQ